MKSLAILAATLAVATQARQLNNVSNSTQDGGKGDRRLAEEDIDYVLNKEEQADCTEENPEDCGRRLQAQLSPFEVSEKMIDVLDTDGDGEVSRDEFFVLEDYGMEDVYLEAFFDLYDTTVPS